MNERTNNQRDNRAVELQGDSPELIAFVLLKNIIQMEQARNRKSDFDKVWLLGTYAECLSAVKGDKPAASASARKPAAAAAKRK